SQRADARRQTGRVTRRRRQHTLTFAPAVANVDTMRRRDFLLSSGLVTAGLISATQAAQADGAGEAKQQIFEIRTYRFASPAKREPFEAFIADAAIPAWNRAGAQPVGVFNLFA